MGFPKMDATLKADWLTALRSGEYKKGVEALRTNESGDPEDPYYHYCCLGVLKEIYPAIETDGNDFLGVASSGITKKAQYILASLNDTTEIGEVRYTCGPQNTAVIEGAMVTNVADFTDTANWIEANL